MTKLSILSLLTVLTLTSCAAMKEEWVAKYCNYDSAYEKGSNDRDNGLPMNSTQFTDNCVDPQKQLAQKGYREGYENARQQETTVHNGASIKIGGTQINIGSKNNKAFYCKLSAFTSEYDGFGATKLEARKAAQSACIKEHHEMHCQEVRCVINK